MYSAIIQLNSDPSLILPFTPVSRNDAKITFILCSSVVQGKNFGFMAVNLGYYETFMSCSGSSTSSELISEEKALAGISPGLVRMSIAYTGTFGAEVEPAGNASH